ncbi:MAG TPA: preprotein translocase subunit YajC [Acidimicrobiales bacterium]|nr:preprotein translocase subunit YajC [Acidimicrobiales bacterium]
MEGLIVLPVFFALMWVLFILPQQKRVKAQQQFISMLSVGDNVVTAGGIHGTIVGLGDETVLLEVADGVELTLARGAIHGSQSTPDEATEAASTAESDT